MPHSAVTVPVSVAPPPSEMAANHEAESFKENSNEEAYKNSTLMVDSAPFEPENQKNGNFVPENVSVGNDVTMDSTLPEGGNQLVNDIANANGNEKHDEFQMDGAASVNENVIVEQSVVVDKAHEKDENVAALMNDLRVDERTVDDKETNTSRDTNDKIGNAENLSITSETDSKSTENMWNDTKNVNEAMNGKHTSSPDTSSSSGFDLSATQSTSSSETKSEIVEEPTLVLGNCKKSWASLFKESPSTKSKPSVVARSVPGEQVNSNTSANANQHAENISSKSSSGNSSLNGMPSISSHTNKTQNYKMSSPSLADDTLLPKIGGLYEYWWIYTDALGTMSIVFLIWSYIVVECYSNTIILAERVRWPISYRFWLRRYIQRGYYWGNFSSFVSVILLFLKC